jgi:hypothetical protein
MTMNAIANASTETLTIRDFALGFDEKTVENMIDDITASFDRRDAFEQKNGNDIDYASSYTRAKNNMLKSEVAVARFFLALNIKPSDVIERKVVENKMFNAKALDKVTQLARFVANAGADVQMVTRAFICCALAFDNGEAIDNKVNKNFLTKTDVSKMVKDQELADYIAEYQHKYMTGGKDTQSSQVRNVLDVLGLGDIVSLNRSRGAIALNSGHMFFAYFKARFMN